MGKFLADPEQLRVFGNKILGEAEQFKQNYEKVFNTVNEMVSTDYLSPDARVLGNSINNRRQDLVIMYNTMVDYGNFCLKASANVIKNQEDNIAGIRKGNAFYE